MNNSQRAPLISVLMPAFNSSSFISDSIESILSQTYSNFEFIIADDCSTDDTWEIIQKYAKKDKRIIALRNQKNLYIAGNRNVLIHNAKGKYIVWQDSDDISVNGRLKILVNFMESHPDVGICGSFLESFDDKGAKDIRKYAENDNDLRKNIFKMSPVAQPSAIIRKNILDQVGDYDLNYPPAEDIDMSFRLGSISQFANVPKVLLKYREHTTSSSSRRLRTDIINTLKVRAKYNHLFGYQMTLSDHLAYFFTQAVQFLPLGITLPLFKFFKKILQTRFS